MSGSTSKSRILLYSFLSSCSVIALSLILQWLIYEDWLHDPGPVRLIGTVFASVVTFLFVWLWQERLRQEKVDTQRRLAVIANMNDRIRNALQAIECITYVKDESATQAVRQSVEVIDATLRGVSLKFMGSHPFHRAEKLTAELHQ